MNNSHSRRRLVASGWKLAFALAFGLMVPAAKAITIPEAVDATNLVWNTGGSVQWGAQAATTHDGVDAAQSGAIGNSQSSYVQTSVTGPGTLSFWWKVSSEKNTVTGTVYDFLRFYLDGVQQGAAPGIGGQVNWQLRTIPIPAGTHTLRWSYLKDGSDYWPTGADAGWLDQVVFVPPVRTTNDGGPFSLRQVIVDAPTGSTILFDPSLSGAIILLTNGQITLDKSINIDASALPGGIAIDGNAASRVFEVSSTTTNVLTALTVTNGYTPSGPDLANAGAGILNWGGTLTLNRCTLAGNSAGSYGGGIFNDSGTVTLNASTLSGNLAIWNAGGVCNTGTLTVNQSTLSGNSGLYYAGCIYNGDTLTVNQSTLVGNYGLYAGGIFNEGLSAVNQSTLTGNSANNSNTLFSAGGIYNWSGTATLSHTIVAGNIAPAKPELFARTGAITTLGNNLTNGVPLLAPLGNYGGPTPTMPPLTGSPAIDGCINGTSFTTDQRGLPRIIGPFADIGAVEAAVEPVITSLADSGFGSLRYAVDYTTNGSLLTFAASLSGQTIVLTSGQLLANKNLTIDASALPAGIALNGNHASRIFEVAAGANIVLDSLTITNGKTANGTVGTDGADQPGSPGGAGSPGESGGGVFNEGTLTLNRVTLSGNTAGNGGQGGYAPQGPGGTGGSGGDGGAIYNASTGTLNILNSTLGNNTSGSGANGGTGGVEPGNGGNGGSGGRHLQRRNSSPHSYHGDG